MREIELAKRAAEARAPRPVSKSITDFEDRIAKIAKRDGVTRDIAMSKARAGVPRRIQGIPGGVKKDSLVRSASAPALAEGCCRVSSLGARAGPDPAHRLSGGPVSRCPQ